MKMRLCPDCDAGIAYGRAKRCETCRIDRKRSRARNWWREHAQAEGAKDVGRVRHGRSAEAVARKRLTDKALHLHPHDADARRALFDEWVAMARRARGAA